MIDYIINKMNKYEQIINLHKENEQKKYDHQINQQNMACIELTRKLKYLVDNPSIGTLRIDQRY